MLSIETLTQIQRRFVADLSEFEDRIAQCRNADERAALGPVAEQILQTLGNVEQLMEAGRSANGPSDADVRRPQRAWMAGAILSWLSPMKLIGPMKR